MTLSIYMITSVCAVRPLPDVRGRGAAVDLARHKPGKGAVWWHYHITRSERRSNQVHEQRAGSRRQANSSGERLGGYRYAHAGPDKLPITERAAADPGEQQR